MAKKLLLADDSVTIQRVIELTFSGEDVGPVWAGSSLYINKTIAAANISRISDFERVRICRESPSKEIWTYLRAILLQVRSMRIKGGQMTDLASR